jgi:hypothetical protein
VSANFLDKSGLAAGCDLHTYFTVLPPPAPPVPVPTPRTPHAVASAHFLFSRRWRIAHSVTTDNWAVLQNNWAMILVPHAFLTALPPHPIAEPVNIIAIVLTSNLTPVMSVHSVTAEGTALCTELLVCGGLNLDCGDIPSGSADFNLNSVKTSPTLGDYIAALVGTALNMLYSWGTGKLVSKYVKTPGVLAEIIKQALASVGISVAQTTLDAINSVVSFINDPVAAVISWVTGKIQSGIDGAGK